MDTIGHHLIISESVEVAARRACAWINRQRPRIDLVSSSQVVFDGSIHTTIFWKLSVTDSIQNDNSGRKSRPKTGEKRLTRQPLKMDRLPESVLNAIVLLRKAGKTWTEIETVSARPFSPNWAADGAGFVDWKSLPKEIIYLFPRRRIPHSSLHRWYDLRIEQNGRSE